MILSTIDFIGLSEKSRIEVNHILSNFPEIESAIVFGSRALGSFRNGSDLDLAVIGNEISFTTILRLKTAFSESYLPIFVDVVDYKSIKNNDLKHHIDTFGKVIYQNQMSD
jgi:predicted nucleotidyltransferase